MVDRPVPSAEQLSVLQRIESCPNEYVIGVDEVGYGACAGPLVVAGVLAHKGWDHDLARDSKTLTPLRRSKGYAQITALKPSNDGVLAALVMSVEAEDVDSMGVLEANHLLTQRVATSLYRLHSAAVVLDGNPLRVPGVPFSDLYCMVGADTQVPAVGAASVLAKVTRDAMMVDYDAVHPQYAWKKNKGYLTSAHEEGLKLAGTTLIHRLSYSQVRKYMIDSTQWQSRQRAREMHVWTSYLLR